MQNSVLRCLVVGYGSIGRCHESVLRGMGAETAVVSRHAKNLECPVYSSLKDALEKFRPSYVVVANRTSEHMETLSQLNCAGFTGTCLVEKPLAEKPVTFDEHCDFKIRVGYVMRFHPLVQKAIKLLEDRILYSIDAYVGQYLPDWRPGTDYRQCYSASIGQGGGALRDLSHELDYLSLLGGGWRRVAALGGHISDLEIDTDDVYGLLMETQHCPVVLCQMNYLDRNVRRDCTIQYEGGTLYLNFIRNELTHNGAVQAVELERNEMFEAMHAAAWLPEALGLCSFEEAVQTLELIEAAERAAGESRWVCRKSR